MMKTVLTIILIAVCALTAVIVMMQQGSEKGLGALSGIQTQDTYWGKNKGRSKEGRLKKLTVILVVAFIGLSLLLNTSLINNISKHGESVPTTSTSVVSTSGTSDNLSVSSGSNAVK